MADQAPGAYGTLFEINELEDYFCSEWFYQIFSHTVIFGTHGLIPRFDIAAVDFWWMVRSDTTYWRRFRPFSPLGRFIIANDCSPQN